MEEFYSRNYLFIDNKTQKKISEFKILILGVGLGSVIAESLLRTGFLNLGICDGDTVAPHNLNRQNYTLKDINKNKAISLKKRLKGINENCKISCYPFFADRKFLEDIIPSYDLIINTIDFDSPAFFACHEICKNYKKIEIFPMNLGFGNGLFVFKNTFFDNSFDKNKIISHIIGNQKDSQYIKDKFNLFLKSKKTYDPQIYIGALTNASIIPTIILSIIKKEEVKLFPKFYFFDWKSFI